MNNAIIDAAWEYAGKLDSEYQEKAAEDFQAGAEWLLSQLKNGDFAKSVLPQAATGYNWKEWIGQV